MLGDERAAKIVASDRRRLVTFDVYRANSVPWQPEAGQRCCTYPTALRRILSSVA